MNGHTLDRTGEVNINRFGSQMIIEKYTKADDIWVRFTEYNNLVHTTYRLFSKGTVQNKYDRTLYGVGFIGEGYFNTYENGESSFRYKTWQGMFVRCYSEKSKYKSPTYKDCLVVEDWHNFQNFAKWYDENYYELENEVMCLDKDILKKGNKIYSPDTCVFVPRFINNLFIKSNSIRGDYPIGVTYDKRSKRFNSQCKNRSGKHHIGTYNTPEEAFVAYKIFKEKLIKQIANKYRDEVPKKLYDALVNYEVEIND